jgi:hypothetical protein
MSRDLSRSWCDFGLPEVDISTSNKYCAAPYPLPDDHPCIHSLLRRQARHWQGSDPPCLQYHGDLTANNKKYSLILFLPTLSTFQVLLENIQIPRYTGGCFPSCGNALLTAVDFQVSSGQHQSFMSLQQPRSGGVRLGHS